MLETQNETLQQSGKLKAEGRRPHAQSSAFRFPHSAFTLVELLVVITIIGILAALITGAAINAMNKAKQAAITMELQQIGAAMEDLKNEMGAYPPNAMVKSSAPTNYLAQNDFVRMFKKAFPRSQEPPQLIQALAGGAVNNPVQSSELIDTGMNSAEALCFWLGGFSSDVSFPISGPGGPSFLVNNALPGLGEVLEDRQLRYEFDLGRLQPRAADNTFDGTGDGRFITYNDPRPSAPANAIRRINLWHYAPSGSLLPIAYFDTSRHTPLEYDLPMFGIGGGDVYALKRFREGVTSATATGNVDVHFVEEKKYQILHCGTDDIWGDGFVGFHLDVPRPNGINSAYQNTVPNYRPRRPLHRRHRRHCGQLPDRHVGG